MLNNLAMLFSRTAHKYQQIRGIRPENRFASGTINCLESCGLLEQFLAQLGALPPREQRQSRSYLQRIAQMMNAEDIDAAPVLASGGLMATPEAVVEVTAQAIGPAAEDTPQAGGALGGTSAD